MRSGARDHRSSEARSKPRAMPVVMLVAAIFTGACGKSGEQTARETAAREAAMQKVLTDSIAEEREKDRRMRDAAVEQANERLARVAAAHESEVASAATERARPSVESKQGELASALRRYTEKLLQSINDPASAHVRKAELSPKQNGMCAEFNARTKAGAYAGFKRVVVTDDRVAAEEPPTRDSLTQFLVFQIAARDTGCFPDVEKVRILQ